MDIHEKMDWPRFRWDDSSVLPALAAACHQQGRLLGRMEGLGFDLRQEAGLQVLTSDVVRTSAIEGEILNAAEVRSSLARRLGLPDASMAGMRSSSQPATAAPGQSQ
jgi:Fic family protein